MSKSTSMLPSLAGGSGVAAHALVDADLMKVVDAVTLNADRDRKVTLAELKAYFDGSSESRLDTLEPMVDALRTVETGDRATQTWSASTSLTAFASYLQGISTVPAGGYIVSGSGRIVLADAGTSTLAGTVEAYIATLADPAQIGPSFRQFVSLSNSGADSFTFVIPPTYFPAAPDATTFLIRAKLGVFTTTGGIMSMTGHILAHRIV